MTKEQKDNLVEFYIQSSETALSSAKSLQQIFDYNAAINRLYYSCFYMVFALLLSKQQVRTKTHAGLISLFNLHFIKTGIVDKKNGGVIDALLKRRFDADYGDFVLITSDEVEEYIPLVEKFSEEIKKLIQQ